MYKTKRMFMNERSKDKFKNCLILKREKSNMKIYQM